MFEEFLASWMDQPIVIETPHARSEELRSLWVHGREACLLAFTREVAEVAKKKHRKVEFADASSFVRDFEPLFDHDATTLDRSSAAQAHKDLERARVLILRIDPQTMTRRTYFWADGLVEQRRSAHRTTVILARLDPETARCMETEHLAAGDMAHIVDRILDRGKTIELSGDGAIEVQRAPHAR